MTTFASPTDQQTAIAAARARAEQTLQQLCLARAESEQRLTEWGQPDHLKRVTGKSALDNAIASAQRVIDTLDRQARVASERVFGDERPNLPVITIDPRVAVSRPSRFARVS